jgi:hypothetical protein
VPSFNEARIDRQPPCRFHKYFLYGSFQLRYGGDEGYAALLWKTISTLFSSLAYRTWDGYYSGKVPITCTASIQVIGWISFSADASDSDFIS